MFVNRLMNLSLGTALALLISSNALAWDRVETDTQLSRSDVLATGAMAATSQPLATQVALQVMRDGGNAIDAAIAANAMTALTEPTGNGIGGDLFAIVWDAESESLYGLNASGRAPKAMTRDWFEENDYDRIPQRGPLPVSVPGTIDGWFELHERFGRIGMEDVLAPTIHYAEEGFPVTEVIAYFWERNAEVLEEYENFPETFMPDGRAPRKGDIFKNPDLANTLRQVAEDGREAFYEGEIAEIIEDYMQRQGGFLTAEDMAAHESTWVDPVSTNYRGYDVWQLPPNTQGIAGLQILNILEAWDLSEYSLDDPDYVHLFTEAKKLAFEDRARFYADPDFVDVPVEELISKEYAERRRALIDEEKAATEFPAGDPRLDENDTIYLTTADSEGNMVSLIQSNYRGMGSGMTPDGLGFILQNRAEMFNLDPDHPNTLEPGKRPFHTIIPAFVTKDGEPWMSYGVMGGAMQPQAHAQIMINMIDFGMSLQGAGDAPRISHLGSSQPEGDEMKDGGTIHLESGFSRETIEALRERGHQVEVGGAGFGGYQAIMRCPESGVFYGASEPRKDGQAAGF
ncbi:gamma-glutamyltranspeptidase/glutathione hydrolase [Natronospira proteinivora]|uniref:Glutathione hydrolase proenzyme n=1 Tax=Natronospira proteinivora TaxID=1807133 RepID=A0ABT1GB35_9GAMM|nr:gamma-glutamyltransferase [Natronospira proteinivora]MCP1728535.1 gamma-glutamyltranspeptidase/glutathione hydrolase [Natronospira proteinivora]